MQLNRFISWDKFCVAPCQKDPIQCVLSQARPISMLANDSNVTAYWEVGSSYMHFTQVLGG